VYTPSKVGGPIGGAAAATVLSVAVAVASVAVLSTTVVAVAVASTAVLSTTVVAVAAVVATGPIGGVATAETRILSLDDLVLKNKVFGSLVYAPPAVLHPFAREHFRLEAVLLILVK
jgi:hypothetical protein